MHSFKSPYLKVIGATSILLLFQGDAPQQTEFLGFQINSMSISLPSQNGRKIQQEAVRLLIEVTNTLSIRTCHDYKEDQWQFLELLHRPQYITAPYRWHSILWYLTRLPMETQANTTSGCPWAIKSQLVDSIAQTGCTCNSLFSTYRGWGAWCGDTSTGESWSVKEAGQHISYLESMAVFLLALSPISCWWAWSLWNGKCIND